MTTTGSSAPFTSRRRNGLFVDRIVGASRTAATGGRTRLAVLYGVAERERRALAAQVARRRDSVREHVLRRRRERWMVVQTMPNSMCTWALKIDQPGIMPA